MKHPSRTCLAAGIAMLASLAVASAAEPTAQIWNEIGAGSASDGGISRGPSNAGSPSAVTNPANGNVFVAWETGNGEIYARKWTGTEWVQLGNSATGGGISNNEGASRFPSIAVAGEGVPVVAWLDNTSGNWEVYLRKFSPTTNTWAGVSGSAEGGGVSRAAGGIAQTEGALPVVGVGGNGQLFVAWAKNATERHVYVSTQSSAGWATLGASVDTLEYASDGPTAGFPSYLGATSPALAVGIENAPIVAYVTKSALSSGDIHVRRWNGTAWAPHGTGAALNGGISAHPVGKEYRLSRPRLAFGVNAQLHAAWLYSDAEQNLANVKRLDGGAWVNAGPALAVRGAIFASELALGIAPDGGAFVSWAEDLPVLNPIGNSEIYVSKLSRTITGAIAWQELGTGSASGTGVSSTSLNSTQPAVAAARTGPATPLVVWTDETTTPDGLVKQIYARRAQPQPTATTVEFALAIYNTKEGAPPMMVQVARRGDLNRETRVRYATSNNTATAGVDYTAVEGELIYAPGEAVKSFAVPVLTDNLVEPSESVNLTLANPSEGTALGGVAKASLVIADTPPPVNTLGVHFRYSGIVLGEGAGRAVMEVIRDGSSDVAVSVNYATIAGVGGIAGTATPNVDYTPVSGTLTFEPGIITRSFEVPVLEDTLVEGRESLAVQLSNPTGGAALVAPITSTISIEDNDQVTSLPGRLQFRLASQVAGEGAGNATIEVIRVDGSGGEVAVNYETTALLEGGADAGSDYTTVSGTLSFGAGVTTRTIQVPILEDTLVESAERFGVKLSAPTGGAVLGAPASMVVQIADNDTPPPPPPPMGVVQFNPLEYTTSEAAGVVNLRVTRSGDASAEVTVDYYTPALVIAVVGVAVPGFDFEQKEGRLTFAPGETEKVIPIVIKRDEQEEPDEFFYVSLRNPQWAVLGQAVTAKVVIASQIVPQPGVFGFAEAEFRTTENAEQAVITVARRNGSSGEASVRYATANAADQARPATAGEDYRPVSGVLTFAAGEVSKTFEVPILQDTLVEGIEGIALVLSDATGASLPETGSKAMLVIADDDQPAGTLQFLSEGAQIREGGGSITLLVNRREGGAGAVTVDFATADGTATAGSDYESSAGTLTFAAGQLSAAITIPIAKDARVEGPETFTVSLSNPGGGATLGTPSKLSVTILDSEPAGVIQFYRNDYVTGERAEAALITVIRSEGAAGEVSVTYSTQDGTATDGEDYTGVTGTLVFAPGQRTKTFTVPILNDATPEAAEKVNLILSAPTGGAVLGPRAMAVLSIADDDLASKVQFAATDYRVREDNLAGYAVIMVVRRGSLAGTTKVQYATSDGTATAGEDYTAVAGELEFRPGQAIKMFRVPLLRDEIVEGAESVNLTLREPTGGILGAPATAILTITDPEARNGSVQFAAAEFKVSEAAGVATITVTRFGTAGAITVKYSASAGTATETDDFTPVKGLLEFAAGEAKKTFTVPIVADAVVEEAETILLELSEPTGGALLGSPARAVLRVFDPALVLQMAR